jgi:hypothetical protein
MKQILNRMTRYFRVLSLMLSGKAGLSRRLSHYPGTARFVAPWWRGRWAPSDPDNWYYRYDDDDDDYIPGSVWYCRKTFKNWRGDIDILKPRATRG